MASTSSSTVPSKTTYESYDVFLSFSGEDTRPNFTSHLYAALKNKSIKTFIDDNLRKGEEISTALKQTIKQSKISIIVFSENYAKSRWCLEELAYILKCEKSNDQIVLPIFYHVSPFDVGNKKGTFGKGFERVKEEFKNNSELVENWSTALTKAADLCGWTCSKDRLESDLIEKVAEHIKELCPITYPAPSGLVGIDEQSKKIISLLRIDEETDRCHSVGVWGMGGIGKTTTANWIFSQISDKFDKCIFFGDVRENLKNLGEVGLVKEFYSKLGFETKDIQTVDLVPSSIGDKLSKKKVLIVLDDVNDRKQLEALLTKVPYGPRSRIIVTSRDKQVLLNGIHKDEIYEMKGFNYNNALQLLSMKAFKEMNPPKEYEKLSKEAVRYAAGLPLALEVLGSHLCNKTPEEWKEELKEFQDLEIQTILRRSYDQLPQKEKDIFLDIVCFFRRDYLYWVKGILNGGGGIRRLADKCLITIDTDLNRIRMHDLIEEMGKGIAQQEGSRLWKSNDIREMLRINTGNKEVQGIRAPYDFDRNAELHPAAFSKMHNLRILIFSHNTVFTLKGGESDNLEYLPSKLSVLHWENYPCKSLPSSLFMENLIELDLSSSNITQLWDGEKLAPNLKKLDLSGCCHLKKIPNLSCATNLEEILLSNCKSLVEIQLSIGLDKLVKLYLDGSESLLMLPVIPKGIQELRLQNSGVREWSQSFQSLDNLHELDMSNCAIESLPPLNFKCPDYYYYEYYNFALDLSDCRNLRKLSDIRGNVQNINLERSAIKELPKSIGSLSSLYRLLMNDCEHLEIIPDTICKLEWLQVLELNGCSKLGELPPLFGLTSLRKLMLDETALQEIPNDIVSLSSLHVLSLENCKRLQGLPQLPQQLQQLNVQNCRSLRTVKSSFFLPRYDYWEHNYAFEFNYCNCWNLDENDRSNILEEAEDTFKSSIGDIMVCVPGSKIPDWYKYQSEGQRISVRFRHNCFDILKFDFSVVVELNSSIEIGIGIECSCIFKNVNNLLSISECHGCEMYNKSDVESDHVFLWAKIFDEKRPYFRQNEENHLNFLKECDVIEASFEFKAHKNWEKTCEVKIKKCGVHIRDVSDYDDDDDDDDSNSKRYRENNEEDEPLHNKRKKEMDVGLLSSTSSSQYMDINERSRVLNKDEEPQTNADVAASSSSYFHEQGEEVDADSNRSGENKEENHNLKE